MFTSSQPRNCSGSRHVAKGWPRRIGGFSLVEVVLAIGIISFGLLSLIGLLPSGLGTLRRSMDQTIHAQILQRIAGDLSLTEYANLADSALYYDADGQFLGETPPEAAHYEAALTLAPPSLPGLDANKEAIFEAHLKRIRVKISRVGTPDADWYALQVAKH